MNERLTCPPNTESVDDFIKSLLIRTEDTGGVKKLKYKSLALEVYRDLNLHTLKYVKRVLLSIDPNTKSVVAPDDFLLLSSLSNLDECNKFQPILINKNITGDIIDMSMDKNCHCECGCKGDLCGHLRNYELIEEESVEDMPDESTQTFTSTTRKRIDADGRVYIERTFPTRIYQDGTWIGVQLKTENEELCKLEVKECGCPADTEDNICKINACCNADHYAIDCGDCLCGFESKTGYNVNMDGRSYSFPSGAEFDKVLMRYYYEPNIRDLRIPVIAKSTFLRGLKALEAEFDEKQPQWRIRDYKRAYEDSKYDLGNDLRRFTITQLYNVLTPERRMP